MSLVGFDVRSHENNYLNIENGNYNRNTNNVNRCLVKVTKQYFKYSNGREGNSANSRV